MTKIPTYWFNWLNRFYKQVKDDPIFKQIKRETNKKCVLIEPRKHPLLKFVVYNFMWLLAPKGYGLHIFCGTENRDFVEDICKDMNEVSFYTLPYDNLSEPLYNMLLTNPQFYECIDGHPDHILIFQTDTILLKDNVDDYLEWDYIGAAWKHTLHSNRGMNGGLSLRNRNAMIKLLTENPLLRMDNEDGHISYTNSDKLHLPPLEKRLEFSVETVWKCECPTGFHATYKFQPEERIKECLENTWKRLFG